MKVGSGTLAINNAYPARLRDSYVTHAFLALAYLRLGKTAESNEQLAVLKQIAENSPAYHWHKRSCHKIPEAELLSVCGPAVKPEKEVKPPDPRMSRI